MTEKREKKVTQSGLTREYKATTQLEAEAASLNWVAALVTAVVVLAGVFLNRFVEGTWEQWNFYIVVGTALVASICFFGIKIANQWERAIVLRLGKFRALKGPGPFFIIPIIETVVRSVDMRIRSTDFSSESTLTKDTVPVNVDAICFWMVGMPRKPSLRSRTSISPSYFPHKQPCVISSEPTSSQSCSPIVKSSAGDFRKSLMKKRIHGA